MSEDYQEVIAKADEVIRDDPQNAKAYYWRGLAYLGNGALKG